MNASSLVSRAILFTALTVCTSCFGDDPSRQGSVTFAFDGGSLHCIFGTVNNQTKARGAIIVHPASVDAHAKRYGLSIKRTANEAVVLVSGDNGTLGQ